MNLREDIKQLKTGDRDLRKFGLLVGGVFVTLGLLFFWRHKGHYPYFLWPGVFLFLIGGAVPRALKWIYIIWMSIAFALGFVMAHVILTLFFIFVIAPLGLLARCFGQDFLCLKLNRAAHSYWLPRRAKSEAAKNYERQF